MRTIVAFDFDGTITRKDTLIEFIKFAKGIKEFWLGFILHSPYLIAYKLNLYPNWKIKEKIFSYYFKNYPINKFDDICNQFFIQKAKQLLYKSALNEIKGHLKEGHEICIISASIENWVKPFAELLGIHEVLCTKIEINKEKRISGKFLTKNCHGKEKVNRLLQKYPLRGSYKLIAYGDSKGDRELLKFADESFYKKFK